jgi:hypothetical protein
MACIARSIVRQHGSHQFSRQSAGLARVRLVHTLAWALFRRLYVALPAAAYFRDFRLAVILIAIVLVEVVVLFANRFRCPLTAVAARYTSDRRANFDIYLPLWIARYNKEIFARYSSRESCLLFSDGDSIECESS